MEAQPPSGKLPERAGFQEGAQNALREWAEPTGAKWDQLASTLCWTHPGTLPGTGSP